MGGLWEVEDLVSGETELLAVRGRVWGHAHLKHSGGGDR
jgi:hypothetical protein